MECRYVFAGIGNESRCLRIEIYRVGATPKGYIQIVALNLCGGGYVIEGDLRQHGLRHHVVADDFIGGSEGEINHTIVLIDINQRSVRNGRKKAKKYQKERLQRLWRMSHTTFPV